LLSGVPNWFEPPPVARADFAAMARSEAALQTGGMPRLNRQGVGRQA
jgi:hypothetical protein